MFVQVIQGHVSDAGKVRAQLDKWVTEVAKGASAGWGAPVASPTTAGSSPWCASSRRRPRNGTATDRNRPRGGARCRLCSPMSPSSTTAQGSTSTPRATRRRPASSRSCKAARATPERARELMDNDPTDWSAFRPEILGTTSVGHDSDAWTMAIYFTSEAAAREGEQKPPPPEMEAMMKEMDALSVGEPVYFDLRDPWLRSPRLTDPLCPGEPGNHGGVGPSRRGRGRTGIPRAVTSLPTVGLVGPSGLRQAGLEIYCDGVLTNRSAPHAPVTPVLTVADVRAAVGGTLRASASSNTSESAKAARNSVCRTCRG